MFNSRLHVFEDLRPYLCTHDDCTEFARRFPIRSKWAEHEFGKHRYHMTWACPECKDIFDQSDEWQSHRTEHHRITTEGAEYHADLASSSRVSSCEIETETCHLCKDFTARTKKEFISHTGQHMEDIAILAIPGQNVDDEAVHSEKSEDESGHNVLIGDDLLSDVEPASPGLFPGSLLLHESSSAQGEGHDLETNNAEFSKPSPPSTR